MTNPSDKALTFEGVKLFLKQDGRGFVLSLQIHPNDITMDLLAAPIGARYTIAMVLMADDGSAVEAKIKTDGERAVASAGMLCANERFHEYLVKKGVLRKLEASEETAIEYLCSSCEILSRKELATNMAARNLYGELKRSFLDYVKYGTI